MQDELFEKMEPAQRLALTWKFSQFILRLHKLGEKYGIRSFASQNRRNLPRA